GCGAPCSVSGERRTRLYLGVLPTPLEPAFAGRVTEAIAIKANSTPLAPDGFVCQQLDNVWNTGMRPSRLLSPRLSPHPSGNSRSSSREAARPTHRYAATRVAAIAAFARSWRRE